MEVGFLQQQYCEFVSETLKGYFQTALKAEMLQATETSGEDYLDIDHIMRPVLDKLSSNYCSALRTLEQKNHKLEHQQKQLWHENCELKKLVVRATRHANHQNKNRIQVIQAAFSKKGGTSKEAGSKKKGSVKSRVNEIKKEIDEELRKVIRTLSLSPDQRVDFEKGPYHEKQVMILQNNCSYLGLQISEELQSVHLYCGNNFFNAISTSLCLRLKSKRISPIQLRSDLCQYLRVQTSLHETTEREFHIDKYLDAERTQSFIQDLTREGVGADYIAVIAMASMIKHDIVIVTCTQVDEDDASQCLLRVRGAGAGMHQHLVVGYVQCKQYMHYISLSVSDPVVWEKNLLKQYPDYANSTSHSQDNTSDGKLVKQKNTHTSFNLSRYNSTAPYLKPVVTQLSLSKRCICWYMFSFFIVVFVLTATCFSYCVFVN